MSDLIIAGLSVGLLTFCTLFIVSFVILGAVTGMIHLVAFVFRILGIDKSPAQQEQIA